MMPPLRDDDRPAITPETRVADLLKSHPQLEDVLVSLAPAFRKLRNPVLRRTVAKVATLDQAARIGGIETRDLVERLRQAAGLTQDEPEPLGPGSDTRQPGAAGTERPAWVDATPIAAVVDADALLERSEHPLGAVRRALAGLPSGEMICVEVSFVPAPLVDALRAEGYEAATVPHAGRFRTCVRRP